MSTTDGITVIGLTGQSGAGKSTASAMFEALGISVINCDRVAHFVSNFPEFLAEVSEIFPDCIDGTGLMRKKLAALVFNDHEKLRAYGRIIFPYITAEVFKEIRQIKSKCEKVVILDAPTLFESGIDEICAAVISVIAPFDVKLRRVLERDNIPVEFASSRLSSQFSEKFFYDRSDWVIINDGDILALKSRVEAVASEIKERFDV